jgi:hypothetical protein
VTVSGCPTELVDAPVEIVWTLLTEPAGWSSFYDLRVIRVEPPGPARVGQRIFGESGPRWLHLAVTLTYTAIDVLQRRLGLEVQMPLGITVREELSCSPISDRQCRVNYHCHFSLPSGWRGALLRLLMRRELRAGPADGSRRARSSVQPQLMPRDRSPAEHSPDVRPPAVSNRLTCELAPIEGR